MSSSPRICIVIPVYNHGQTVQRVVRAAKQILPVTVVNDGSTDQTAAILAGESGITVVTLASNQGKGAALRAGFAKAEEQGFTHAITLDADGQHSAEALPEFVAACGRQPEAFLVGVRDFKRAGAPWVRRVVNELSNFWFRFETGLGLADTQCGYRCYPLSALRGLRPSTGRYAFELEVLVKAVWAGFPLVALPVQADYAAPTSRLSHFDPIRDMVQLSWLHSRLSMQAFCLPAPLRRLWVRGQLGGLSRGRRVRTVLEHLFSEHTETTARLATAVGLGLFCGIMPIWGFQMLAAAALAHKFGLNKAIALTASHISFPLAAPVILASGLVLGHFLWTGGLLPFDRDRVIEQIPLLLWEWVLGSVVLAILVGVLGGLFTFLLASLVRRKGA